jgi:hypothetical protein
MKLFLKAAAVSLLLVAGILASIACAENWSLTVIGASGGDPRWSPSGKMLSVWRGDTVDVYNMDSLKLVKNVVANRPWSYCWYGEDCLAVFYKKYTEASRPCDRNLIATNATLRLDDGSIKVITYDTVISRANCTTPWEKLPDGTIGVYRLRDGARNQFLKLTDNRLVETPADTSRIIACESRFQSLRSKYEYHASPNCAWAFAYRAPDEMTVLLDSAGQEILTIGPRVVRNQRQHFDNIGDPQWSACGRYVTYEYTEDDGHYLYNSSIYIVDTEARSIQVVTNLMEGEVGEVYWSPVAPQFVVITEKLGGVALWHRGSP